MHGSTAYELPDAPLQVDWDKGKALLHLLAALGLDKDAEVLPIYIGDDRTDEDAFKALRGRAMGGTGILVSSKVWAHILSLFNVTGGKSHPCPSDQSACHYFVCLCPCLP